MNSPTDAPTDMATATPADTAGNTANDQAKKQPPTFRIWYITPAAKTVIMRNTIGIRIADNAMGLTKELIPITHRCVDILHNVTEWPRTNEVLRAIYDWYQGENWSPNGEARPLIAGLQLEHTSMSVGDVIELCRDNRFWMVADYGFTEIER